MSPLEVTLAMLAAVDEKWDMMFLWLVVAFVPGAHRFGLVIVTPFALASTAVAMTGYQYSADVVAADAVSARLIGLNPDDIEYLILGERRGLGVADLARIEVRGLEAGLACAKLADVRYLCAQGFLELQDEIKAGRCDGANRYIEKFDWYKANQKKVIKNWNMPDYNW